MSLYQDNAALRAEVERLKADIAVLVRGPGYGNYNGEEWAVYDRYHISETKEPKQ